MLLFADELILKTGPNEKANRRSATIGALLNRVAALSLLALCIAAFACTGGADNHESPTATPQASGGPPAVQEMILYLDIQRDVVAVDPTSRQAWRRHLSSTTETVSQAECTRDGSRIAYLDLDTSDANRQIVIA